MTAHRPAAITAAEVIDLQSKGEHVVLLDVRFLPGKPSLRHEYDEGHAAGAHFVQLSEELQGVGGGTRGTRPLPEPEELQYSVERWGIRPESTVVAYSNGTAGAAARAWFTLRWAGVDNVRYLDGGLAAWRAAGGPVSTETPEQGGGTFVIERTGAQPTIDADDVDRLRTVGVVLDARKATAYAGEDTEGGGHVPGARSVPAGSLLRDGYLRPESELRQTLAAVGADGTSDIGVYCGGGVAAALETLVLHDLGIDAGLFVGSFSAWSADPARPVERVVR